MIRPTRGIAGPGRAAFLVLSLVMFIGACGEPGQPIRDVVVTGPDGTATAVRLPAHLDRAGLVPDRECRYRVTAHVELTPALKGRALVLVLPSLSARATASIDDETLVAVRGGDADGYRHRPPLAWAVPARLTDDGVLDIELEVEHTWTQSAWLTVPPELVRAGSGLGRGTWVERVNLVGGIAGVVVILSTGLIMVWVFLLDRRRRTSGLFALVAFNAAAYPAAVAGLLIPLGRFEMPLMCSCLVISNTLARHYTHAFFKLPPPPRRWTWVSVGLVLVFVACSDPYASTYVDVRLTVLYLTFNLGALFWTVIGQIRARRDRTAWLFLLPWMSLALTAPADFLSWTGVAEPGDGARLAVFAFSLFPLLLELLHNDEHVGSLNQVNDQLATQVTDLETRRAEIEQLNLELRRQLADRAAQIHAALLLARGGGRSAPALAPGDIVQHRYRVVRPIGAGGMGTVYQVTRLADGRPLALKLAREVNGETLARLAREVETAATVTHPHVVGMLDVDVASEGYLFLVMELVEGQPLSQARPATPDRAWAVEVLAQLADGLAALHDAGVIHRDLKPANILIAVGAGGAPVVKITDFGIALPTEPDLDDAAEATRSSVLAVPAAGVSSRLPIVDEVTGETVDAPLTPSAERARSVEVARSLVLRGDSPSGDSTGRRDGSVTRTGHLPGTPSYMAPELARGRAHLSVAADMFAFGIIAWELLVGGRPFTEPVVPALLAGRAPVRTRPLLDAWPDAPPELAEAIERCLDFVPTQRPTAVALARILKAARGMAPPASAASPTAHSA